MTEKSSCLLKPISETNYTWSINTDIKSCLNAISQTQIVNDHKTILKDLG